MDDDRSYPRWSTIDGKEMYEAEAKRKIFAHYTREVAIVDRPAEIRVAVREALDQVLRIMAERYAVRIGYRDEWRP